MGVDLVADRFLTLSPPALPSPSAHPEAVLATRQLAAPGGTIEPQRSLLVRSLALDLATGERAWLRIEPAARPADSLPWAERCAALTMLWHPTLAECLDYGETASSQRFEAYRVSGLLPAHPPQALHAPTLRARVAAFLTMSGVEAGELAIEGVDSAGRWVVVPGPWSAGQPPPAARHSCAGPVAPLRSRRRTALKAFAPYGAIGVRLIHRSVYDGLRERLCAEPPPGFTVTDVEAGPGAGGRTLLRYCAREARRLGWVALAPSTLRWIIGQRPASAEPFWNACLSGRHIVLLHDGRHSGASGDPELAALVLHLGTRVPRPHRLVRLVLRGCARDVLRLAPLSTSELAGAVVLAEGGGMLRRKIAALATASGGMPGPFVEAVLRLCASPPRVPAATARAYIVHDTRATFGVVSLDRNGSVNLGPPSADCIPRLLTPERTRRLPASRRGGRHRAIGQPATAGLGEVWRAVAESERLVHAGRHAAAERLLRHAAGAQARRGCEVAAGDAVLACGALHAVRGRSRVAVTCFTTAASHYEAAGAAAAMAVASTWLGRAHLDLLHTEESEGCLRTAAIGADLAGHGAARAWANISLARTLWWLGRNDEAYAVLQQVRPDLDGAVGQMDCRVAPSWALVALARAALLVRVTTALGDLAQAAACVTEVGTHAAADGTAAATCLAHLARAHWLAVTGELRGLDEAATAALRLARESRRPLDAVRSRILRCQAYACAGARAQVAADAHALRRALARGLPDLLAARARVALAAHADPGTMAAATARYRTHGLVAFALPRAPGSLEPGVSTRTAMIEDVIEVLRICEEEEDARTAILGVARLIQARTRADSVVLVAAARHRVVVAWPAAGRQHLDAAQRVIDTGLPLTPHETDHATEAAHPVRCGGSVIGAVACRWSGASPVDAARTQALLAGVAAAVTSALRVLLDRADAPSLPGLEADLVGVSGAMEEVRRAVARAADAPYAVLVQGESGVGKELVARAIHRASARRSRPFCALNCAALPDELIEAELFGHARGAFTGAVAERRGLFEDAEGGVLFLDEIGELAPRGQAKLLRVIQENEIRRVGETMPRRVDVRLVAATNRSLEQEVEGGRFRRDLWYRLDVIRIAVPPLRERPEDVALLASAFWRRTTERVGSRAVLSDAALAALARYDWPGNVRELQNVLAALAVASPRRGSVGASALPATLARVAAPATGVTLEQARRMFETRFVRAALARAGGHRGRAAAELGVTRQGLAKLMDRLGVDAPQADVASMCPPQPETAAGR